MKPVCPILFLTRPEAQSCRFADEFRARFGAGWPVVIAPLSEIVPLDPALPAEPPAHVVFTSENTVAAFTRLSSDRTALAWCVGPRTQAAARAAGFSTRLGPGDGAGLAQMIASDASVGRVLYPRPVHAAGDIPAALKSAGIETIPVVVYDQREQPLSAAATAALVGPVPLLLPLFSPRSARLAAIAARGATAPLLVAAISPAVAAAACDLPAHQTVTAARPDGESMLDALGALIAAAKTG